MFQRGNNQLKRCYHIVLSRDENTLHLREFGKHVLGYDIKQDFMSARFKLPAYLVQMHFQTVGLEQWQFATVKMKTGMP